MSDRPISTCTIREYSKISKANSNFRKYQTDTGHVCTYLNAFFTVIPNTVMKFQNVDIFKKEMVQFLTCRLLSSAMWKELISQLWTSNVWSTHLRVPSGNIRTFQQLFQVSIIKPIQGMFVLIWMHFSRWFQIKSWNSRMLTFFYKFVTFLTCRLLASAAWKELSISANIDQ